MERIFSRRDADHAAAANAMTSSSKLIRLLRAKFSESKAPTDLDNWLDTIFADDTEENNSTGLGAEKPRCGVTWTPLFCAVPSDSSLEDQAKVENPSPHSHVADELLPVFKSEKVFGRTHEKTELLSQLLSPNNEDEGAQFSVISIYGVGGIGKTTVVRQVFDDETVQKHFAVKVWVKVAGQEELKQQQQPPPGIAREIIKSATGVSCRLDGPEELDEMVRDALLFQRSLIVLDEIESTSTDSWLHMKGSWFDFVGSGSKVIITTCSKEVVNVVSNSSKPSFELGELSQDAAWSLYSSLAFDNSSRVVRNIAGLIPMARRLAARCRGVPLTLKLLGSLVRFEEGLSEMLSSRDLMENINPFLNISFVLSLSISALSFDLIQCFAYSAIFPRGHMLNKDKLIKMWIANGFVKPSTGTRSLEDTGNAYFHQLLCRSFSTDITCNEYGDVVEARMPTVVHSFAQNIARIVCREKVGVVDGIHLNPSQLSLALPFGEEYSLRDLRTLINISPLIEYSGVTRRQRSFLEFKRLRSLDLSYSGIQKLSKNISVLKKLRYLNLSHTLIRRLPESLPELLCLQALDLSGCYYLKALPKGIGNLTQLTHLDLSKCSSLSYLPYGIGLLKSLETMPLFVLGKSALGVAGLQGLLNLHHLRGRLHIANLEYVKVVDTEYRKSAQYFKHKNIHHLGLSWSHHVDECFEVLKWLEPNPQLKTLDLTGYQADRLPYWITTLRNLIKISITDWGSRHLPKIGHLPFLKELLLKGMPNIEIIDQEFYSYDTSAASAFPSLEKLGLYNMPKLQRWSSTRAGPMASRTIFPNLKALTIQGCTQLQMLPTLPCLAELVVWNSNSNILSSLTRVTSLSSLVINDMDLGDALGVGGLKSLSSVKKLLLVRCRDLDELKLYHHVKSFNGLEHLGILDCPKLKTVKLFLLNSLRNVNIVDCENLTYIQLSAEAASLRDLVVDDCPQLVSFGDTQAFGAHLQKLIIRHCPLFSVLPQTFKKLRALEYLFIGDCPRLEGRLQEERDQISDVRQVILGNHKVG